jgi:beta-N-acetylhexosaminidase
MKDLLRGQLGFDGIIITDAMNMGAIVDTYGFAPAAETAIEAGADMVLLTGYLEDTRSTVMQAIADGRIPEEQIDASVRRILRVKYEVQRERYGIQEQTSLEEMQTEG